MIKKAVQTEPHGLFISEKNSRETKKCVESVSRQTKNSHV